MNRYLRDRGLNLKNQSEQGVAHQPAISFSISFQFQSNRAGGRTSNVLQEMEPMIDACQAVLEREAEFGRNSLDEQATAIFHLYRFLCDYENGGLSGFLYNISSEWDDLASLGAIAAHLNYPELAAAISEVESVARSGPDDFQGTWGGWLDATDPEKRLAEIDDTISEHYQDLWDDLERLAASPSQIEEQNKS